MSIMQIAESFGLTESGELKGVTNAARRRLDPRRQAALREADALWGKAWGGDRMASVLVNEAMSTSDLFVSATGDLLDRELLARFNEVTPQWQGFASPTTVRNFKAKKLVDLFGGRTALDAVPELTEYPYAEGATNEFSISAGKFGRRFGYSWEANVNDDLDELSTIPDAFATAATLTEDKAALSQIVTVSSGAPLSSFFKSYSASAAGDLGYAAFDNSGTKALTTANLASAVTLLSTRKSKDGNLVPHNGLVLVVGPALQFIAERILNASEIRSGSDPVVVEPNYLKGKVRLVVHPSLAGNGWFLLPDPARAARPALAVAHLRGYETPDIRVANNQGTRVGGGAVNPDEGDFEIDGVWYRVRHVVGAAALDPIHTYGSTGADGTAGV